MHSICWLKCPEIVWVSCGFQHQWGCLSWWLWLGFTRAKQIVTKPTMYVSMTCLMGIILNLLVYALRLLRGCFFVWKEAIFYLLMTNRAQKRVTPASENETCVEIKVTLSYRKAFLSLQEMHQVQKQQQNHTLTHTKQEMHIYTNVEINASTSKNKVKVTCSLYHLYVHERHKCTVMDRMIEPYWGSTGTHVHREVDSLFQGKHPRSFHVVRKKGIQIHSEAKELLFFFQNEKKTGKKRLKCFKLYREQGYASRRSNYSAGDLLGWHCGGRAQIRGGWLEMVERQQGRNSTAHGAYQLSVEVLLIWSGHLC